MGARSANRVKARALWGVAGCRGRLIKDLFFACGRTHGHRGIDRTRGNAVAALGDVMVCCAPKVRQPV